MVRGAAEPGPGRPLRVGLLADLHYGERPADRGRHFREGLRRMAEAVRTFNARGVDLVVALGDLIEGDGDADRSRADLAAVEALFGRVRAPRHYVPGNHCLLGLTKAELLEGTGARPWPYSLDAGPCHLVVLDGCFRCDGVEYGRGRFEWRDACVPDAQLAWLEADLAGADRPALVFVHHPLDGGPQDPYTLRNAEAVRAVVERSGRVRAVLQGHRHANNLHTAGGVHYLTLAAAVEAAERASSYGLLELDADGTLRLEGFGDQASYHLPPEPRA